MSTAHKISVEFDKITNSMKKNAKVALNKVALDLVSDFTAASPVDVGTFRAAWDFKEDPKVPGIMVQVTVYNSMPYAGVLDVGSPRNKDPWPSAGPKTVERDGRIWSSQAPQGVTGPIVSETYLNEIQKKVSQFVLGDL